MIEIVVADLIGCESAKVSIAPGKIAMIAGPNGAGKSTFAKAAGAALGNKPMPGGEAQKYAGDYVKPGAECATAMASVDEIARRITWGPGAVRNEGELASIGASAAGFAKFSGLELKDRATFLNELLEAKPTKDDLVTALASRIGSDRTAAIVDALWQDITALGWESVYKTKGEDATYAKRRWQEISGKPRWDTKIGMQWQPEAWDDTLFNKTVEELQANVTMAAERHLQVITQRAVDEAALKPLREEVAQLTTLGKAVEDQKTTTEKLGGILSAEKATLAALPPATQPQSMDCPGCKCSLVVRDGKLLKAVKLDSAELALRKTEIDKQQAVVKSAEQNLATAETEYRDLLAKRKSAESAAARLKEASEKRAAEGMLDMTEEQAIAELQLANRRRDAKKTKADADEQHLKVLEAIEIQEVVQPAGLRREKLAAALREFSNDYLAPLCKTAKWEVVDITPELDVTYKGIDYNHISAGQRFRADFTLQVAFAMKQAKPIIIVDYTDSADANGQGGMMNVLTTNEITAIVCLKAVTPSAVPDLASKGVGHTYWMENGWLKIPAGAAK
jgi:energy-coupling factor transporter ATP-binding protein EcfA2